MRRFLRNFTEASIGVYLMAMALAIAVPILVFVALLLAQLESNERATLERRTRSDAQSLAASVGKQLQDMSTSLRLLTTAPELETGDLRSFHNRTRAALHDRPLYVLAVRADGQQLVNTRVPFGTELGRTSNLAALKSALEADRVVVSDVFYGETSNRWVFNVIQPLPQTLPSGVAALIMTQNADELGKTVTNEGLPPGWSAALIDADGNLIASSDPARNTAGKRFAPALLTRLDGFSGVVDESDRTPGNILGYATLPGWSWKIVIWGPVATAQASILSTWKMLLTGGLILLAIAIVAAYLVGRQLRGAIKGIASMAERMGNGEIVAPLDTKIVEANQVAVALSNASFDRSEAEDHIHLILRELAHRTKNMLTLIQAMMRQTGKHSGGLDDFQKNISQRLEGLGRSVDLLTSVEWSGVGMRRLAESHLETFAESPSQVEIRGDNFQLKPEAVQNMGLVLHELATNAVKYGALSDPNGKVRIEWTDIASDDDEPQMQLTWAETGGPAVEEPQQNGFGTTIIEKHAAAAFGGSVSVDFEPGGLRWTMTAPYSALRIASRKS